MYCGFKVACNIKRHRYLRIKIGSINITRAQPNWTMHPLSHTDILTRITAASANDAEELSIIRLSEPIAPSAAPSSQSPSKRRSDASTDADAFDNLTPATLEADLTHYQVVFLFFFVVLFVCSIHFANLLLHRNSSLNCASHTSNK